MTIIEGMFSIFFEYEMNILLISIVSESKNMEDSKIEDSN